MLQPLLIATLVSCSILETGGSVTPLPFHPGPSVVHPVELVCGEVENCTQTMRNLRVSKPSSSFDLPFIQTSIKIIGVEEQLCLECLLPASGYLLYTVLKHGEE